MVLLKIKVIDEEEFTGGTGIVCGILNYYSTVLLEGDRPRPIKITFSSRDTATQILEKSPKLKDLESNVYIKGDKTKSEIAEFQRLGEE